LPFGAQSGVSARTARRRPATAPGACCGLQAGRRGRQRHGLDGCRVLEAAEGRRGGRRGRAVGRCRAVAGGRAGLTTSGRGCMRMHGRLRLRAAGQPGSRAAGQLWWCRTAQGGACGSGICWGGGGAPPPPPGAHNRGLPLPRELPPRRPQQAARAAAAAAAAVSASASRSMVYTVRALRCAAGHAGWGRVGAFATRGVAVRARLPAGPCARPMPPSAARATCRCLSRTCLCAGRAAPRCARRQKYGVPRRNGGRACGLCDGQNGRMTH